MKTPLYPAYKRIIYKKLIPAVVFLLIIGISVGWVYTLALLVATIGWLMIDWRWKVQRCHHCDGEGHLHGHDAYVNRLFTGQHCYMCRGSGFVNPGVNEWYHLWQRANEHKFSLLIQKREFRKKQINIRQRFRPYLMEHDLADDHKGLSSFATMVQTREKDYERLISYYYQIECYSHRILFQKYKKYAEQQWLLELQTTNYMNDEYYLAKELEGEADFLRQYDYEIQGLESITTQLKALSVSEALVIELEASTERLKQERAIA